LETQLLEGEDYTVDKNGNFVFTRQYHLKRGYCCESNCLNCPYDFKVRNTTVMTQTGEVSTKEAKEALNQKKTVFIDIRDPDSFQEAHIEGSQHVTDESIQEFISKSDKSQPVIVYCFHGNSSQGAAAYLQENGFKDVKSMAGGFEAWRTEFPSVPGKS